MLRMFFVLSLMFLVAYSNAEDMPITGANNNHISPPMAPAKPKIDQLPVAQMQISNLHQAAPKQQAAATPTQVLAPSPQQPISPKMYTTDDKNTKTEEQKKVDEEQHVKRVVVTESQLQNILDKFTLEDKEVIKNIQMQIINWPTEVFDEVRNYREFVIKTRKIAKYKYNELSEESKESIKIEKELKAKLSPEALKLLDQVELQS